MENKKRGAYTAPSMDWQRLRTEYRFCDSTVNAQGGFLDDVTETNGEEDF